MSKKRLVEFYKELLNKYGYQGWWPLLEIKGVNPTKTGKIKGYHPKNYEYPKNKIQIFEICLGAILTQNTSWQNVERALINLKNAGLINPKKILYEKDELIKESIKSSGYFNQKARKLKEFSKFFVKLREKKPTREELLNIWGIGKETADSILLYAYKEPVFVVDSYTKKIFEKENFPYKEYDEIQEFVHKNLKNDFKIYQEFHALLVEHAKHIKNNL